MRDGPTDWPDGVPQPNLTLDPEAQAPARPELSAPDQAASAGGATGSAEVSRAVEGEGTPVSEPAQAPAFQRTAQRALLAGLFVSVAFWVTGSVMRNLLGVEHVLDRAAARAPADAAPGTSEGEAFSCAAPTTWNRSSRAGLSDSLAEIPPEGPLTGQQERLLLEARGLMPPVSRLRPGEEPDPVSLSDEPSHPLTLEGGRITAAAATAFPPSTDTTSHPIGNQRLDSGASPALLWLAAQQQLFQYEPATGRLQNIPLPPGILRGTIERLVVDGQTLYLGVGEEGLLQQLLRLDVSSGLVASLPLPGTLEALGLLGPTLWGVVRSAEGEGLIRLAATVHGVRTFPRPTEGPGEGPPVQGLFGLGSRLVMVEADHTLGLFDPVAQRWEGHWPAASGGGASDVADTASPAPRNVLAVAPWGDSLAISSSDQGLQQLREDGTLTGIEPRVHLTRLVADGRELWGIEPMTGMGGGSAAAADGSLAYLARYNGNLGRWVRYAALASAGDEPAGGSVDSSRPSVAGPLGSRVRYEAPVSGEVLALLPWNDGVAVVTSDGVWRWRMSRQKFELLLLSTHRESERTPKNTPNAEVEAVLAQIASLPPVERKGAYEALLQKGAGGYEEVFLVGLNEDDPATLESVTEYFRSHHPVAAIEPLLDVLLLVQGDKAFRRQLTEILTRFQAPVMGPVVRRLTTESAEDLAGGAREALEQVLVGAVEQGGVSLLNSFLATANPEWLTIYGSAEYLRPVPPPVNAETFRIVGQRLGRSDDPKQLDGVLRVLVRLARRPDLPTTVAELVPRLIQLLQGRNQSQALYALALLGDERAVPALERLFYSEPATQFWSLQALMAVGVPPGGSIVPSALRSGEPEVRLAAAAIARLELVPEAIPLLRRQLLDEADGLCLPCVEALMTLRDPGARPVLEARLARSRREEQVPLLQALAQFGDPALAGLVRGWVTLEILAPARVGRLSLKPGPSFDVLLMALGLIGAYGGKEGRAFITEVLPTLPVESQPVAAEALQLADVLPGGLGRALALACLGEEGLQGLEPIPSSGKALMPAPAHEISGGAGVSGTSLSATGAPLPHSASQMSPRFRRLRPLLFALVGPLADAQTRGGLERILLAAPEPADREEAARALFFLKDPASRSSLEKALSDPYFQAGPFPQYYYPVRRAAARALEALGVRVARLADRRISVVDTGGASTGP